MLGNVSSTRRRSRTHLRTSHSRRGPGRRWLALAALAALLLSVISAGPSARPTLAATTGAPIVIGGDVTNFVDVFDQRGVQVAHFDGAFTIADGLAVGDVNGDGADEILIAGDVTGIVDIFDLAGIKLGSFNGNFTFADGFAVGDVMGDSRAEILIAGDVTGDIDIFDEDGNLLTSFDGDYTLFDGFAVGDVTGGGKEEILVAGDFTGTVDVFNAGGTKLFSFDGGFTLADGLAAGDVNGDGTDEILIAGDVTGVVDIFNAAGTKLASFDGNFTIGDGFAAGDVLGDVREEILIAGDVTGIVDVFDNSGNKLLSFDASFTVADGFAVGTAQYPDQDGDGLLDSWETQGIDMNNDGIVDVDLPAFGADPLHKDLFLEYDWVTGFAPTQAEIQGMKAGFLAAPVDAGGTLNPDGLPGINLWVDTGSLTDPTAAEDGQAANTCSDGIDNTGDGLADAADPDCLVGDNLGGGNAVAGPVGCLDDNFYDTKSANFSSNRRLAFRYAISGNPADSNPCGGGRGEIGGNDFVEYNTDGGTIMHELGHTLNLRHGGNTDSNCKPNYVSVMNYDLQFGIPQRGGGGIFDYSPPRFTGGRGSAPIANLSENNLNESTVLDASDATNFFAFVNSSGAKMQWPLNNDVDGDGTVDGVDWNGNNTLGDTGVTANLDTSGTNGRPSACTNGTNDSTLGGHDDWSVIRINFRPFGDSQDGALNPWLEPEPNTEELLQIQEQLNTTDLALAKVDLVDPAVAGEELTYRLTVTNNGPNPAYDVQLVDTLPAGVTYQSASAPCSEAPVGTLTCDLGDLYWQQSKEVEITVLVAADLVYNAGGPTTITNAATVSHLAGPDNNMANNSDSEDTLVVAVADLEVVSFEAVDPPAEILVGEDVEIVLHKVITNHGPSAPMDTELTQEGIAPPGATVSPALRTFTEPALALEEQREVTESFTIRCLEASHHIFTFTNTIAPLHPEDTDPDLSNNSKSVVLDIECVVPVAINIHPHSYPNAIRPGNGVIPVAVLTTAAGEYGLPLAFDATTIDPLTVRFAPRPEAWAGGGAAEAHDRGHIQDSYELDEATRDGDPDMVLHFVAQDASMVPGVTEGCVKGEWTDANGVQHKFFGCDSVRMVPPNS